MTNIIDTKYSSHYMVLELDPSNCSEIQKIPFSFISNRGTFRLSSITYTIFRNQQSYNILALDVFDLALSRLFYHKHIKDETKQSETRRKKSD